MSSTSKAHSVPMGKVTKQLTGNKNFVKNFETKVFFPFDSRGWQSLMKELFIDLEFSGRSENESKESFWRHWQIFFFTIWQTLLSIVLSEKLMLAIKQNEIGF